MKRHIRWLKAVKLPSGLEGSWTDTRKPPAAQKSGFKTFKKGDETVVHARSGKIFIKR